ncbi:protein of unknown function [Shinella sp. WSC3-e]|nr:hypothetical protein SHINE37_41920 [Rhizobiaceae bacterium]CAK7256526.1 protein of unknown function [Shinella sp. WSC3-e]
MQTTHYLREDCFLYGQYLLG